MSEKKRYSIPNGNGTYRIPLTGLDIRIEGNPPCIFGDIARLVGKAEDLGDLEELAQMVKSKGM